MLNITEAQIAQIAQTQVGPIVRAFVKVLRVKGEEFTVDSWLRVCHFVAQCAEESDHFNTTVEYASGAAYEGRTDLGNTALGDGKKYKGRGVIQLTGKANYQLAGAALGLDLVDDFELAADPEVGTLIALWYWKVHKISPLADQDDLDKVTRAVNGGLRGLDVRRAFLEKAKNVISKGDLLKVQPQLSPVVPVPVIDAATPQPKRNWFFRLVDGIASLFGWRLK